MIFKAGTKVHFIGIGGVGMDALAKFFMASGAVVSGSDRKLNDYTKKLSDRGAVITSGEHAEAVDDADAVIFSSAIKPDNAEFERACILNKSIYERHELLGAVSREFKEVVAVAGTHGKTTVTAMLTKVFKHAAKDFVAMIGGESVESGNYFDSRADFNGAYAHARNGNAVNLQNTAKYDFKNNAERTFLTEACEYKRSLLSLNPTVGIVLNAECDHPDCYENLESVKAVFKQFLSQSKKTVTALDDVDLLPSQSELKQDFVQYSKFDFSVLADFSVFSYKKAESADKEFNEADIYIEGKKSGRLKIKERGEHNLKNALFAAAAAYVCGVPVSVSIEALKGYKGVKRRFEYAGKLNGKDAFFDFAHHPTEIKCALNVAAEYGKVLAVFQPHTYSRTAKYMEDFVKSLCAADVIIIMPTYGAREKAAGGADSGRLAQEILKMCPDKQIRLALDAKDTLESARLLSQNCDTVLFIGAGDIYDLKADIQRSGGACALCKDKI